jgi:CHAT domain-containing protein
VLNACESGVHGTGLGNEIRGFVRALLLGGVRHVVCTLESVADGVAREFAAELYQRLRSARNPDIVHSVWEAQRTLARKYAARPELWRPFILVG